jgi:hypothetical protein
MKPKENEDRRKRKYTLAVLILLTTATIATGWATQQAPLMSSERIEQTIMATLGRVSS